MKCDSCGITIPELPEDATYDEKLCDKGYSGALMTSFNQKIVDAHDLACQLGEIINADADFDVSLDDETTEMIWGHADGLSAKWLYARRDGLCSIQAMIDFDPDIEEARIDAQIITMQNLLEKDNEETKRTPG